MKIYVITKGCYSDYHICAVATDPGKAARLAKIYSDGCDVAEVEEFDTAVGAGVLRGRFPFEVCFYENRGPIAFDKKESPSFEPGISVFDPNRFPAGIRMAVRLYAPDEITALKIACDKRAKYLAEKAGI